MNGQTIGFGKDMKMHFEFALDLVLFVTVIASTSVQSIPPDFFTDIFTALGTVKPEKQKNIQMNN